jgi:hypothetical protein
VGDRLTDEQRRLIAGASKFRERADEVVLESERTPVLDISTYVVEAPCSVCADPLTKVQVHPRWVHAARCSRCIREGHGAPRVPMSDDREPTITWERLREPFVIEETPEGIEKHPEPVVTSLDPVPEGTEPPASVRGLQKRAEGLGWFVNLTYARGNGVHGSTGRPTKLVDSWAVRCWRGRRRAVAVYSGGSWSDMWGIEHMFHARTVAQFEAYLAGIDEAWLRRTRAENLMFEAHEPCTSGDVHGEHPWWKKDGAGRYCSGRETPKSKKTREAGG